MIEIIWLSSKKMENAIANRMLSNQSRFTYLFLTYFLFSLSGPVYLVTPKFRSDGTEYQALMSLIVWFIDIYITYSGIKKCYMTNRSIDDFEFIERFTILNIRIFCKCIVIVLPISLMITWWFKLMGFSYNSATIEFQGLFVILAPFAIYTYYYFLNKSFMRLKALLNKMANLLALLFFEDPLNLLTPNEY